MNSAPVDFITDRIHIGIRRAAFMLSATALLGCGAVAVVNRATLDTYSPAERTVRSYKPPIMSPTNPSAAGFIGIQTGRVYAGKTPALAQTTQGQSVYNDRRVVGFTPVGEGITDSEVEYVAPGNPTPIKTTATAFMEWVGKDVTESLPPAVGGGTAGEGVNWRAWAGGLAERPAHAATAFAPGAGQLDTASAADAASVEARANPIEGGEGGPAVEVKNSPATGATADNLANAQQTAANAQQTQENAKHLQKETRTDSSDNTATASNESLKSKARKH